LRNRLAPFRYLERVSNTDDNAFDNSFPKSEGDPSACPAHRAIGSVPFHHRFPTPSDLPAIMLDDRQGLPDVSIRAARRSPLKSSRPIGRFVFQSVGFPGRYPYLNWFPWPVNSPRAIVDATRREDRGSDGRIACRKGCDACCLSDSHFPGRGLSYSRPYLQIAAIGTEDFIPILSTYHPSTGRSRSPLRSVFTNQESQ
jgi:hypothetical protein